MNFKLIQSQLIRNVLSYKFVLVLAISFVLAYLQLNTTNNWYELSKDNFLLYTLNFDAIGKAGGYYMIFLPFLAALMGGSLFGDEIRSQRYLFHLSRISKKEFTLSTLFSSFLLGGLGGFAPMVISLLCATLKMPHFQKNLGEFPIFTSHFWGYSLFQTSPIGTMILLFIIIFIFSGLIANISIIISYSFPLRIIELLTIFLIFYVTSIPLALFKLDFLSPQIFLNFPVSENFSNSIYALIGFSVFFIVIIYLATKKEIKSDATSTLKKGA